MTRILLLWVAAVPLMVAWFFVSDRVGELWAFPLSVVALTVLLAAMTATLRRWMG